MIIEFSVIFIISIILAVRSMSDLEVPSEVKKMIVNKKGRGTILFFKGKTVHYHAKRS